MSISILIAPDSFKGTVSASQAAALLQAGMQEVFAAADVKINYMLQPLADGGEGTAALFHGERISLPTTNANGRLIEASYIYDAATTTAYIDVAAASGLPLIAPDDRRALFADTYGTGVLIADAQTRGATRIVLGLGGSATTDAGTGILVALGATPLDAHGHPVTQGGQGLASIASIDTAQLNIPAAGVEWVLLTDIRNPAIGPHGSATVYGPQKGATPEEVEILDRGLAHFSTVVDIDPTIPGMGAAGGVALSITWLSKLLYTTTEHVHILPGIHVIADAVELDQQIAAADIVITGEGRFDEQSLHGKVVGEVLRRATTTTNYIVAGQFTTTPPGTHQCITLCDATPEVQFHEAGKAIATSILSR